MFVAADEYLLNTVQFGAGPPTLVAHGGWVGNWELWQEPFQLMQSRWRCIAYDHRGAGASTFPPEAITPEGLVEDLFTVLDAYRVDSCVLAGESLGALTCLLAAARDPARFRGLVLVDGVPAANEKLQRPPVEGSRTDFPRTVSAFVDACVPEPLAIGEAVAAAIPGSELVVIPDAGHVPTLTRPREVVDAIERWAQAALE